MENDTSLTIYLVSNPDEVFGLDEKLSRLASSTEISIKKKQEPAVLGGLAGDALHVILSDPVQAVKSLTEIGLILWGVIRAARVAGKRIRIGKGIVRPLLIADAEKALKLSHEPALEVFGNPIVWGPMNADPLSGFAEQLGEDGDGMTSPTGYFMAIIFPRAKGLTRTAWYLLSSGGSVAASWTTQTRDDRLPGFLRPRRKDGRLKVL